MKRDYPRQTSALTVPCRQCGKVFTRSPKYMTRLCPACERARKNAAKYYNNRPKIAPLSGMSPVRRRIEMRRRANPEYYANCGEVVP